MKDFSESTQQELLALATTLEEEEDNRTYSDVAEAKRETYLGTSKMFTAMAEKRTAAATVSSTSIAGRSAITSRAWRSAQLIGGDRESQ